MTPILALSILLAAVSLLGIISTTMLTLRLRRLNHLLKIQQAEEEEGRKEEGAGGFAPVLRRTDLHVRLNQVRQRQEVPEKYRFIRSMADRGMPAAEIAEILGLGSSEVDQLMALAKVAQRQPPVVGNFLPLKKGRTLIKAKDFSPNAEMII